MRGSADERDVQNHRGLLKRRQASRLEVVVVTMGSRGSDVDIVVPPCSRGRMILARPTGPAGCRVRGGIAGRICRRVYRESPQWRLLKLLARLFREVRAAARSVDSGLRFRVFVLWLC